MPILESINTMLENHHLEFIKQTMLKHEDTFRHQVRELHRLYNVQKNLMGTLKFSQHATLDINHEVNLGVGFDLSRPAKEDTSMADNNDQNDVELTLSIGPSNSKRRSENRLHHQPAGGNETTMKTNFSNSSTLYNQDRKRPHWLF